MLFAKGAQKMDEIHLLYLMSLLRLLSIAWRALSLRDRSRYSITLNSSAFPNRARIAPKNDSSAYSVNLVKENKIIIRYKLLKQNGT